MSGTVIGIRKAVDRTDAFYVRNAELASPDLVQAAAQTDPGAGGGVIDPTERRNYAVYAHRIREGRGTIFAWRFYSNGDITTDDDETYRKFTLWIDGPPPTNADIEFSDPSHAVAIYTYGGSAWPQSACAGRITGGSMHIESEGTRFKVHIAVQPDLQGYPRNGQPCGSEPLNLDFVATEVTQDDLTPWLGQPGSKPYDETYRR